MTTTIQDYVCNLIAGRDPISNLYFAVDRARDSVNKGLRFCYKASFRGIGNKVYQAKELFNLDTRAFCTSMSILLNEVVDGQPTLDQYIMILLKGKNQILTLYQQRYRALFMRSTARIFHYKFVNPFGLAAGVMTNTLTFGNAQRFLNTFCLCQQRRFDPQLVLGGLS